LKSIEYCSEAVAAAGDAIGAVVTAIERFRQSVDDLRKSIFFGTLEKDSTVDFGGSFGWSFCVSVSICTLRKNASIITPTVGPLNRCR